MLALRNDYRLGVLNGTRGTIDHIDRRARTFTLDLDDTGRVTVPFSYAEAGHLTHGYSTTIHKAQGLTVDRCLVLLDDTSAREHTYTALSRGRRSNDVYFVRSDHRVDERHATELEPEGVDALRAVAGRSADKQLAVDQTEMGGSTLADLQRDRDQLAAQIGTGPPDVSYDYQRLQKQHRQTQNYRDGAAWRRDRALEELDRLGPIGRRTHRAHRRELETRINGFVDQVAEHDAELSRLTSEMGELIGPMLERSTWNTQHAAQFERLSTLDRQIELKQRLDRFQHLERTNELERGLEQGMDLGW